MIEHIDARIVLRAALYAAQKAYPHALVRYSFDRWVQNDTLLILFPNHVVVPALTVEIANEKYWIFVPTPNQNPLEARYLPGMKIACVRTHEPDADGYTRSNRTWFGWHGA